VCRGQRQLMVSRLQVLGKSEAIVAVSRMTKLPAM